MIRIALILATAFAVCFCACLQPEPYIVLGRIEKNAPVWKGMEVRYSGLLAGHVKAVDTTIDLISIEMLDDMKVSVHDTFRVTRNLLGDKYSFIDLKKNHPPKTDPGPFCKPFDTVSIVMYEPRIRLDTARVNRIIEHAGAIVKILDSSFRDTIR